MASNNEKSELESDRKSVASGGRSRLKGTKSPQQATASSDAKNEEKQLAWDDAVLDPEHEELEGQRSKSSVSSRSSRSTSRKRSVAAASMRSAMRSKGLKTKLTGMEASEHLRLGRRPGEMGGGKNDDDDIFAKGGGKPKSKGDTQTSQLDHETSDGVRGGGGNRGRDGKSGVGEGVSGDSAGRPAGRMGGSSSDSGSYSDDSDDDDRRHGGTRKERHGRGGDDDYDWGDDGQRGRGRKKRPDGDDDDEWEDDGRGGRRRKKGARGDDDGGDDEEEWEDDGQGGRRRKRKGRGDDDDDDDEWEDDGQGGRRRKRRGRGDDDEEWEDDGQGGRKRKRRGRGDDDEEWEDDGQGGRRRKRRGEGNDDDEWESDGQGGRRRKQKGTQQDYDGDDGEWESDGQGGRRRKKKGAGYGENDDDDEWESDGQGGRRRKKKGYGGDDDDDLWEDDGRGGRRKKKGSGADDEWEDDGHGGWRKKAREGGDGDDGDDSDEWESDGQGGQRRKVRFGVGDDDDDDEWESDGQGGRRRKDRGGEGNRWRKKRGDDDDDDDDGDEWESDGEGGRRKKKKKRGDDDDDSDAWEDDGHGGLRRKRKKKDGDSSSYDDYDDGDEWESDGEGGRRRKRIPDDPAARRPEVWTGDTLTPGKIDADKPPAPTIKLRPERRKSKRTIETRRSKLGEEYGKDGGQKGGSGESEDGTSDGEEDGKGKGGGGAGDGERKEPNRRKQEGKRIMGADGKYFSCYCGRGDGNAEGDGGDEGTIQPPDCICADDKIQEIYRQLYELNLLEGLGDEEEESQDGGDETLSKGVEGEEEEEEEEVEEEDQLVVLDPDHPLMIRFQNRLKEFLDVLDEDLTIQLRDAKKNLEEVVKEEKAVGQRAKDAEEDLKRRRRDLEEAHAEFTHQEADRKDKEEVIKELRIDNDRALREESAIRRVAEEKQKEVEKSDLNLYYARGHQEGEKSSIEVRRRAAMKAKQDVSNLEPYKEQQDRLVDRWLREERRLQEEVATFEILTKAQREETKAARDATNEAKTELEAINMEKKEIMQQWSDSLLLTKKRDDAKDGLQAAIDSEQREERRVRSEVAGYKRAIVHQHHRNEQLAQQLNRVEGELATYTNLLEKNADEYDSMKQEYSTQHKMLQQTELNASRARIEAGDLSKESRELLNKVDAIVATKREKEDKIETMLKQQLIHDNQANSLLKKTELLRETTRSLEKDASALASEVVSKKLDVTELDVAIRRIEEKLTADSRVLKEKDELLDQIEQERNRRHSLIERKQVNITSLMHKVASNLEATGGEELGPLEVQIKQTSRSIDEVSAKTMKVQERWLWLQNQLVAWQRKYDEIDAEATHLGKTIIVWEKKKAKTEKVIAGVEREIVEMEHNCDMTRKDSEKLNLLLFATSKEEDMACRSNAITEECAYRELEEMEHQGVRASEKLKSLQEEKSSLLEHLDNANTQIALWERKIDIQKEMKSSVDKMWGQGELGMMKTEVQKMQLRMRQLKHQQELLVQDMERAVTRRESIHARGNKPFKPWEGKSSVKSAFMRENEALAEKIKKLTAANQRADGELKELQEKRDGLADTIFLAQPRLSELQREGETQETLLTTLTDKKQLNLQRLVADQQKNKWYEQVKNKKYVPSFKTKEATNKEIQKQLDRLHQLSNIVEKVRKEHPETHHALRQQCGILEDRVVRSADTGRSATAATGARFKVCRCGAVTRTKCTCERA